VGSYINKIYQENKRKQVKIIEKFTIKLQVIILPDDRKGNWEYYVIYWTRWSVSMYNLVHQKCWCLKLQLKILNI